MSLPPLSPLPRKPAENKDKKATSSPQHMVSGPKGPPLPPIQPKYAPSPVDQSSEEIELLNQQLAQKENEMTELNDLFVNIKSSYETLNLQSENLKTQIETLKSTVEMKDEQLQMKEDQMASYSKMLEDKNAEIDQIKQASESVQSEALEEKEGTIAELNEKVLALQDQNQSLENEMKLLKDDIEAADKEVEELHQQMEPSQSAQKCIFLTREEVLQQFKEGLKLGLHNVSICVPSIDDLSDLDLYDVKTSVNIKIACDIDRNNTHHMELLQEYQALENVSLRVYDGKDRWTLMKDNESLFMAVIGDKPEKYLSFAINDERQIKFFSSISNESWLRGRKI
jgi:predicted  nucleic acid-binding Zn-ribbon protein